MTWSPPLHRLPGIPNHQFARCGACGRVLLADSQVLARAGMLGQVRCLQCLEPREKRAERQTPINRLRQKIQDAPGR